MANFIEIPIVEAARRGGLLLDLRTLGREEVEAACPFCGDHGMRKYHLSLNTARNVYRCNLCGAKGNSVTLYAFLRKLTNREAYQELAEGSNVYLLPSQPTPKITERQPAELVVRDAVYREMLSFLTLSDAHRRNLRERGLSDERIEQNGYKSMPATESSRRLLADLVGADYELLGIPGFYTRYGRWTVGGPDGFLIPVRDRDGLIQGMKVRLDDAGKPNRKYRWLSTRHEENGTRSYSWIHVTGDRTRKRAYLTEGPLKGDVASFLAHDALFVCTGGVNATKGLRETIENLGVTEVVEAMDMDQFTNPQVMRGIKEMRKEVMGIPGLRYSKYTWNPAYKGVDDYLLSRVAAM